MKKPPSLPASVLRARLDPARIPWADSAAVPRGANHKPPQPRAMQALELAMHIRNGGYNIYLSGEPNLGRRYMLKDFLRPRLKKYPCPPDLLYVHNFDDPDTPKLITVPAGQGRRVKTTVAAVLGKLRKELPARFENDAYSRRRSSLVDKLQARRDKLFRQMDAVAGTQGFNLDMDESGGMTLYPLVEGKRLSEQDFDKLGAEQRKHLRSKGDTLVQAMSGMVRKLGRAEQDFFDDERSLEKEVVAEALDRLFTPPAEKLAAACKSDALARHFADVRAHILDNLDSLLPRESAPQPSHPGQGASAASFQPPFGPEPPLHPDDVMARCEINLLVDNAGTGGAPLVFCDHPTPAHLLGCIEREAEMGALITDFSLIKAGAIHKANGGFLILSVEDLIQHPAAWEGLLRALRSGEARIEDTGEGDSVGKTKGIAPQPLPLSLKVILVGTEDVYESLLLSDERFGKLFKVKAQLTDHMPRDSRGVRTYLYHIRRIAEEAQLPPFDREALAGLVDAGSLLIEDQRKLTLKFSLIREIMIEAAALASMRGKNAVDGEILRAAMRARTYRVNLVEEAFMEEYDKKLIKVDTKGEAVGRVNGLSVTWYGDFEFGLPHRIAASVGAGHDGIIDLERESKLGGPIHTKAMLILKSYLVSLFARNKPLVLTGSLCFEQSYAGIEGDSASGAELAALLSALAEAPLRLSLAFTGAVSQSGHILAVGGVTRKIEGFFEVCRRHGLTGEQGVILPADNLPHLMLKEDVVEAVEQGKFHIHPVKHITEAMELLTGLPAGRQRKNGSFTPGSLYARVDERLTELARLGAEHRPRRAKR